RGRRARPLSGPTGKVGIAARVSSPHGELKGMHGVDSREALLDPAFLRELEALRRRLAIRVRSGAAGEHTARRRGGAAELLEHRPYAAGDDLRRVDWAAYARSGEPVVKVFHAEEDVVVRLVCDASASMRAGEPPKSAMMARLAAAIGYMTLAGSERAQIL